MLANHYFAYWIFVKNLGEELFTTSTVNCALDIANSGYLTRVAISPDFSGWDVRGSQISLAFEEGH